MSELKNTIKTLAYFNEWRRGDGDDLPQLTPRDVGIAIDSALRVLREVENLLAQKGRHQTEAAYKRLVEAAK